VPTPAVPGWVVVVEHGRRAGGHQRHGVAAGGGQDREGGLPFVLGGRLPVPGECLLVAGDPFDDHGTYVLTGLGGQRVEGGLLVGALPAAPPQVEVEYPGCGRVVGGHPRVSFDVGEHLPHARDASQVSVLAGCRCQARFGQRHHGRADDRGHAS
jgi:hypothetical protein